MNLAQSPTLPPPSSWFVPYPFVPAEPALPPPCLPGPGSHALKTLQYLRHRRSGAMFRDIWKKIGGENSLGSSLRLLKERGFVEGSGTDKWTHYQITQLGKDMLE